MQSTDQAECRGLNAKISAERGRIVVSYAFPPKNVEILLQNVLAIEFVVNSIFPSMILSIVSGLCFICVWWFAGAWSWPIVLSSSYLPISRLAALLGVVGLVVTAYAWYFGKINIATVDNDRRVTVQMIPKRSGQIFVNSIRSSIQETEY